MSESTEALLKEGRKLLVQERAASEAKKTPTLRGGSAGAVVPHKKEDKVYGNCHRLAHLRWLGLDVPPAEADYWMFDEGLTSEDILNNLLQAGYRGPILFEEDMPVTWHTEDGEKVTGRCDAVVGEVLDPKEALAVEKEVKKALAKLKKFGEDYPEITKQVNRHYLMSLTAKRMGLFRIKKILEYKKKLTYKGIVNVHLNREPDGKHLIQLAHYSLKMAETYGLDKPVDAELIYRWGFMPNLDSEMRMDEVAKSGITELVESRVFGRSDWIGKPGKIKLGSRIFDLTWDEDGWLNYTTKDFTSPIRTVINEEAIEKFYDVVSKLGVTKNLGPRPSSIHPGEGIKAGYSQCGFCKLRPECVGYENDYDVWLDMVKVKIDSLKWFVD